MKTFIRRMELSDLDQVYCIELACDTGEPWTQGMLKNSIFSQQDCIVIENKKEIMGFLIAQYAHDEAEILDICVMPAHQRKGYGKKLLNFIMREYAQKQVTKIFLEVRKSNIKAKNLYQKLGFSQVGIRKDYYKAARGYEDAIMLALEIKSSMA